MKQRLFSEAIRQAMTDEMEADSNVFLLGEDIGEYGGAFGVTKGMLAQFGPERIINTPISENSFTGLAIGAALMGSRPIVEIMFMDFAPLIMDQLLNQAAKIHYVYGKQAKCPLVIRMVGGGGRNYGPTHSQNLEAWFMHIPGLKVFAPATVAEAYSMMRAAIRDDNPVVFLEHKLLYAQKGPCNFSKNITLRDGTAPVLAGDDITIISYSYMLTQAYSATLKLQQQGITVDLLNVRCLNPLDDSTIIASARKTGRVLIVAEDTRTGGVAAEIACRVFEGAHDYLDAPIKRLTAPDVPIPASPSLEKAALPNQASILHAAINLLND